MCCKLFTFQWREVIVSLVAKQRRNSRKHEFTEVVWNWNFLDPSSHHFCRIIGFFLKDSTNLYELRVFEGSVWIILAEKMPFSGVLKSWRSGYATIASLSEVVLENLAVIQYQTENKRNIWNNFFSINVILTSWLVDFAQNAYFVNEIDFEIIAWRVFLLFWLKLGTTSRN